MLLPRRMTRDSTQEKVFCCRLYICGRPGEPLSIIPALRAFGDARAAGSQSAPRHPCKQREKCYGAAHALREHRVPQSVDRFGRFREHHRRQFGLALNGIDLVGKNIGNLVELDVLPILGSSLLGQFA